MTRAEKVAEAQRLRAQGLKLREIGERMGASPKTVHTWLSDPDLSRQRALRDERYRGVCEYCGGPTDGSGGYKSPKVCQECLTWSEEAILDAMRRWAEEHGGMPPRESDWCRAAPEHPTFTVVVNRFGWNEMLLRAGFKLRTDRRPETQEWIEKQIRAGVPTQEIADKLGVTYSAIAMRLYTRGLSITALRNGGCGMKRASSLHRKSPLRRHRKPVQAEPGEAEYKTVKRGACRVCGAVGPVRRHHVVTEQRVRAEGGNPWCLENAMWVGLEITCGCHERHHSKSKRIPLARVSDEAAAFAVDLLGVAGAADWFRRHYDCGEGV